VQRLEKVDERAFYEVANGFGLLVVKLNLIGRRGLPDRMVIGPNKFIVFFEFKRAKTGKLSKVQERIRGILIKFGFDVVCPTSKDEALNELKRLARKHYIRVGGKL